MDSSSGNLSLWKSDLKGKKEKYISSNRFAHKKGKNMTASKGQERKYISRLINVGSKTRESYYAIDINLPVW